MQVCYLINQLAPGGAPTLLLDIIQNTSDDDVSYTVCYIEGEDTLVKDLRAAGAEVIDFGASFKFDPRALYRMMRFFRRREFDILHLHLPYSQTIGRLFGTIAGVNTIISTQHNIPDNYHPVTRFLEQATRSLDDATIAVSKGVEEAFRGRSHLYDGSLDEGWCTIYNGIDVDEYNKSVKRAEPERSLQNVSADSLVYLNVARYVPAKSQTDLVDAMDIISEKVPGSHLIIVGWGECELEIRDRVSAHGLENSVTVTGRVPSVFEYYALADVFVSSSIFEGLPITHLEAMAAELPIVATNIPGVKEVVVDGETGRLVPTESSDALADAMIDLSNTERRTQMGVAGYARASDLFSIDNVVKNHLQLYRGLNGGSGR